MVSHAPASGMMVGMADEVKCSGRGLVHPLFWTGLAVLLVNDRFLKHAHLVPGAITGKLSDFAGMLVTPVVLTALSLRARGTTVGPRLAPYLRAGGLVIVCSRARAPLPATLSAPICAASSILWHRPAAGHARCKTRCQTMARHAPTPNALIQHEMATETRRI